MIIPAKSYKDSNVYKLSFSNTVELIKYFKEKKFDWIEGYLVDQLIRAAASIGANLAEGYGRMYKKDYRRFVSIARGSSLEVEYWSNLISVVRIQDAPFLAKIVSENTAVIKMLTGMMKSLDK